MPGCSGAARVIIGSAVPPVILAMLFYSSRPIDPGAPVEALASAASLYVSVVLSGALVLASTLLLHSPTLGLASSLAVAQVSLLGSSSALALLPVASSLLALLGASFRFRGVDSVLEVARGRFRPTPIAAGLASMYLITVSGIGYPGVQGYVIHAAGTLAGGLLYARISRSIPESIVAGVLLGLGPAGALLVLAPQAFRSIDYGSCSGIRVGRLVGVHTRTSPTRAIAMTGPDTGIACSSGDGALSVSEPLVLWLYSSKPLEDSIALTSGGRLVIDLVSEGPGVEDVEAELSTATMSASRGGVGVARLGGLDPIESRVALASAALSSPGVKASWLVIVASSTLSRAALEVASAARGFPRILVALDGLPGGRLAPPLPGRSSGVLIVSLQDPGDQDVAARSLLGSKASILRELLSRGLAVGYPYCGGGTAVFEPRRITYNI